jgi:uncharacterized protein YjbJ (UPF0337 family)
MGARSTPLSTKETNMRRDVLEGKWTEMRGRVKEAWGALTDDDLDRVGGRAEALLGVLQQRYGYARERAEQEIKAFLDRIAGPARSDPRPAPREAAH